MKIAMKKYLILLGVSALTLAACTKEIETPAENSSAATAPVYHASFDNTDATKLGVAEDYTLYWNRGDLISVFNTTANKFYTFSGENGDRTGDFLFSSEPEGDFEELSATYAIFPSHTDNCINEDGTLRLRFPSTQYYRPDSFADDVNPMVAVTENSEDYNLNFKNVGGILVIPIKGNISLSRIDLRGNSGEPISGWFNVAASFGENPSITASEDDALGTNRVVSLIFDDVPFTLDPDNATDFWFVLPPTEFQGGFTVKLYSPDCEVITISTTVNRTITRNTVNRMAELNESIPDELRWKYFLNPETGEPAVFTFTQTWWNETVRAYVKYYEIDGVRHCITETFQHYYNGFYDGEGFFGYSSGLKGDGELRFIWYPDVLNNDGKQVVELSVSELYYYEYYGSSMYGYDYYHYLADIRGDTSISNMSWLEFKEAYGESYPLGYYDNGGFYFYLAWYYLPGIGGWRILDYDIVGLGEGFYDYTLSVYQNGACENGEVPVTFELGRNVDKVVYVFASGELTSSQIESVAAGLDSSTGSYISETGEYSFNLGETGTYTLVAVSLDADGNAQDTASATISYLSAQDAQSHVVDIHASLVSADTYNANTKTYLGYSIYGSGIVSARYALFSRSDLENDYSGCVESLMEGDLLSSDAIEAINGSGYNGLFGSLKPGTEYGLLVYANDGFAETVKSSEYISTSGEFLPVYQDFTFDSYNSDYEIADRSGWIGTWNYYAVDYQVNSLREYIGKVTVRESETATSGPDDAGGYHEFVCVNGLWGDLDTDDTYEMDVYNGAMYTVNNSTVNDNYLVTLHSKVKGTSGWNHANYSWTAFIPVMDGYYAFVDVSQYRDSYNFAGLALKDKVTDDVIACMYDLLLVDPDKDNNGLAAATLNAAMNTARRKFCKCVEENSVLDGRVSKQSVRAAIGQYMKDYRKPVAHVGPVTVLEDVARPVITITPKSVRYVGKPSPRPRSEKNFGPVTTL